MNPQLLPSRHDLRIINPKRPTIGGVPIWDGTHHGDTDPNGPIGGQRGDISNGF